MEFPVGGRIVMGVEVEIKDDIKEAIVLGAFNNISSQALSCDEMVYDFVEVSDGPGH